MPLINTRAETLLIATCCLVLCGLPRVMAEDAPPEGRLPSVLIIGDSISIGYTPHVAKLLSGEAVVRHHKGNAGPTGNGLKMLEKWLGKEKWDIIHFNWGLHDLCYRNPKSKAQGHRDKINGTLTTSLEQYEKNLDQLVSRLKKTGAALIWAHTTVVPEGEVGRFVGDDKKYNEAATRVMKKHGITIDDLHALTAGFPPVLFKAPGNVHYKAEGYRKIAEQVSGIIREKLKALNNSKALLPVEKGAGEILKPLLPEKGVVKACISN